MGIYSFYLGKGIIFPVSYFEHKFKKEIKVAKQQIAEQRKGERYPQINPDDRFTTENVYSETVRNIIAAGPETINYYTMRRTDIVVDLLGHDAFRGRDGYCNLPGLDDTRNGRNLQRIKRLYKKYGDHNGWSFIFIGQRQDVGDGNVELSYSVPTSELLYSLPAFLPSMTKLYRKFRKMPIDLSYISKSQKACIWTYAIDCCQCCT